jgi:glycosyltransferase involved in cell wall biosynthesis
MEERKMSPSKKPSRACFVYYQELDLSPLLYREIKALEERGFAVDVICLKFCGSAKNAELFDGMKIYRLQSRPVREANNKAYLIRLGLFFLKCFFLLAILGPIRRYAIVHVTSPPDFMVFAALVPKLLGAKIILDIHDINPEFYMRRRGCDEKHFIVRILLLVERYSAKFSNHVIAVTDLWREKLIARSVDSKDCTVILNAPDENVFPPSPPSAGRDDENFILLYHGSLEEHFGVDTLLKAMVTIKEKAPNARLIIYGSGRMKERFEEFIEKEEMGRHINIFNPIPFYDLPRVIQGADIGVVPTKDAVFSGEALSMKSLEYLASGVPIVISGTEAHRYYYSKDFVRFFDPRDHEDLARGIVDLYEDEELRDRMIRRSSEFFACHGWKTYKKRYFDIIDRLTAGG